MCFHSLTMALGGHRCDLLHRPGADVFVCKLVPGGRAGCLSIPGQCTSSLSALGWRREFLSALGWSHCRQCLTLTVSLPSIFVREMPRLDVRVPGAVAIVASSLPSFRNSCGEHIIDHLKRVNSARLSVMLPLPELRVLRVRGWVWSPRHNTPHVRTRRLLHQWPLLLSARKPSG
jgi:hypothetical protein